jgi:hypothetical protein
VITTKLAYTRDISRIFARRCVSCHGEGASIPLTSYEQVRPWAVDIKEQVLSRAMPPWGAVKGFGDLAPDLGLTQEEILIISAWVVGGAPQGDAALLPKGKPDVGKIEEAKFTDGPIVKTRVTVAKATKIIGIKPQPDKIVDSARITARFPDGKIQPLLWLYRYDPQWQRTFRFREKVELPAGTVVESNCPLQFVLEIPATQSALTGTVKTVVSTTP